MKPLAQCSVSSSHFVPGFLWGSDFNFWVSIVSSIMWWWLCALPAFQESSDILCLRELGFLLGSLVLVLRHPSSVLREMIDRGKLPCSLCFVFHSPKYTKQGPWQQFLKAFRDAFEVHIKTTLDIYLKAGLLIIGVLTFHQKAYKSLILHYLLGLRTEWKKCHLKSISSTSGAYTRQWCQSMSFGKTGLTSEIKLGEIAGHGVKGSLRQQLIKPDIFRLWWPCLETAGFYFQFPIQGSSPNICFLNTFPGDAAAAIQRLYLRSVVLNQHTGKHLKDGWHQVWVRLRGTGALKYCWWGCNLV